MPREQPASFDVDGAHRHFSAACFNDAWALIDQPVRTAEDDEAMVLCAAAALWHWMRRPDCMPQNLSIGHWQLARVCAILGQGENAMRHAKRSLALAANCAPFYVGYAHEAVARAAAALGDKATRDVHLELAARCAAAVPDAAERKNLEQDLQTLGT